MRRRCLRQDSGPGPPWKFPRTWRGAESASRAGGGGRLAAQQHGRRGEVAGRRGETKCLGGNGASPEPTPRATVMLQNWPERLTAAALRTGGDLSARLLQGKRPWP